MGYKLKIISWNANGINSKNKLDLLINLIIKEKIDIILLNETRIRKNKNLKIKGFTTIRRDRNDNSGHGGVAIFIKNNIDFKEINPIIDCSIEHAIIQLSNKLTIIIVYNSPINNFIQNDILKLTKVSKKMLIIGDLNARHQFWNCQSNNANGRTLLSVLNSTECVIQYPDTPTHYPDNGNSPSTIDIIINKNVANISNPTAKPDLPSDHNPIMFTIYTDMAHSVENKFITSYKTTNWQKFRNDLDNNIKITPDLPNTQSIDTAVDNLSMAILRAKRVNSHKIKINRNLEPLPTSILNKIKNKNKLRKLWQRTQDTQIKTQLNRMTKDIATEITTHKNDKWNQKLSELSTKDNSFWKFTKNMKKPFEKVPTLSLNNIEYIKEKDKTEILAETFEKVHIIDSSLNSEQSKIVNKVNNYLEQTVELTNTEVADIITNPEEIIKIIKRLKNNKAPGIDTIDNILVKNFSRKAIVQFMYIVNAIIKTQYYPIQWKVASIVPIPKPNKDKKDPSNYRPISLLNVLSKITDKIILNRFIEHDHKNKITIDAQFGFRERHNTTQQITRITTHILESFDKRKNTAMLLLDIQKAFDRVWLHGLVYKLIIYKFPQYLIKLLHSYLTDRKFKVKINNSFSTTKNIQAGVPQGSVLGPKLFTLFINDIKHFNPFTNLALYADDTAIYATSFSAVVANTQIQIHANEITKYLKKWKINLNPNKTENILYTRKYKDNKIFSQLTIDKQKIPIQNEVKYLGIHLDKRLTFKPHIKNTLRKAYGTMKCLFPLLSRDSFLTRNNKKLLYTSVIRPILTYAAPAWCHVSKTSLKPLQIYQNKCLRLITNKNRYTKITKLHEITKIENIREHINKISKNFYSTQLKHNKLTKNLIKTIQNSYGKKPKFLDTYKKVGIITDQ